MKTSDFLDILEQRKLAPADIVGKLRAKAEKDKDRVTPKAILKYLVKKEIVPRSVAYQLLKTTLTVSSNAESSIMGFVPLPETPLAGSVIDEDVETLAPVDSGQNVRIDQIDKETAESSDVQDDGSEYVEPESPHLSSLASLSSVAKERRTKRKPLSTRRFLNQPNARSRKRRRGKRTNGILRLFSTEVEDY